MSFPDGVRYVVTDGYPWLEFFDDENPNELNAPFWRQDVKPDSTGWSGVSEVREFAEKAMQDMRDNAAAAVTPAE